MGRSTRDRGYPLGIGDRRRVHGASTPVMVALFLIAPCLVMSPQASAQQFVEETTTRFPIPNPSEYTNQATIGDLDGDGDLDIVFANANGFGCPSAQLLRIYINDGSGFFTDETAARTGNLTARARGVELGDIERDGDLDIIVAQECNQVAILLVNDGAGNFTNETASRIPSVTMSSARAQFGDLDNDGDLDLFFCNGGNSRFGSGPNKVFENNGSGFYTDVSATALSGIGSVSQPMDAILADIDGDFDLDVNVGSRATNGSRLYKNNGDLTFVQVAFPNDVSTYSYDFGDIDGDGDLDMLGANSASGNAELLLRNNGAGVFSTTAFPSLGVDDNDSKFIDIDNDGDLDAMVARIFGPERAYINNGSGSFTLTAGILPSVTSSTLDIKVADLTGDGAYDVVGLQGESGNFVNRIYVNTGPADTNAPRMIDTEQLPTTSDAIGPYVVRTAILDDMTSDRNFFDKGITLHYRVSAGVEQLVDMYHSGGQIYRGEIPGQVDGSSVEYWVSAIDFNDNEGVGGMLTFSVATPVARPLAENFFAEACGAEDDPACVGESYCIPNESGTFPGTCYVPKNRRVSIDANPSNAGLLTARLVTLASAGGGNPLVLGWVGQPVEITPVNEPPYLQAPLTAPMSPFYMDWSTVGTVHLTDCHISPGNGTLPKTYVIESIEQGQPTNDPSQFSPPLALRTTVHYGDVVGPLAFPGQAEPPDGAANFQDVFTMVSSFQGVGLTASAVWTDLVPEIPDNTNNFADIFGAVAGFQSAGAGYPFSDPCTCAGTTPCP